MLNVNAKLAEQMQIVPAIMPVDLNDGANNGDWVSLKNFERCTVVVVASAGTAANDLTVTLNQATAVAGTGTKALSVIDSVATKQGAALSAIAAWTEVTQTAAATYTNGTNGEEQLLYAIDVLAEQLDVANGFDCLQCSIAQVGAAKIGCALYLLWPTTYGGPVGKVPGAIAD